MKSISSPTKLMVPNDSNKLKKIENVDILFQSGLEVWNTNDNSTNNNNIHNNLKLQITNSDLTPISLLDTLANLASLQSPISNGHSNGSPNSKQPHNIFPFSNNNNDNYNTAIRKDEPGPGGFTRGAKAAAAANASLFSSRNSNLASDDINLQNSTSNNFSSSRFDSSVQIEMDLETNNHQYNSLNTTDNVVFPLFNRRARAMSEPWLKSMSSAAMIEGDHLYGEDDDNGEDNILPQMMEHYRTIYNKNGRIGIYTREERKSIISRFHDKRKKRVWKKKIRYHCRKNLADRRIRVKGRFVKAEDMEVMDLMGSLRNTNDWGSNDSDMKIGNNNKSSNSTGGKKGKGKTKQTRRPPLPPKSSTTTTSTSRSISSDSGVNPNIQFDINAAAAALEAKDNTNINDNNGLPPKRMRRHSIAY